MCNVVNYAFFSVNTSGLLTVNNPTLVPQVINKAKANGAKVLVSINDGAYGSDNSENKFIVKENKKIKGRYEAVITTGRYVLEVVILAELFRSLMNVR